MFEKIVKNVFGIARPDVAEQAEEERRRNSKDSKLVDLAHEAVMHGNAQYGADLKGLVDTGWPNVKKEKFKRKVNQKVWDIVKNNKMCVIPDMVDEITDRIVDVSEADEFYSLLFGCEDSRKKE